MRLVIYVPGHSEVWRPVGFRDGTDMAAVAAALSDRDLSRVAPGDGAMEGDPAGTRLLMLDRVLAWLCCEHPSQDLSFLFLVTEQAGGHATDTMPLEPLLRKWAEHRRVGYRFERVRWAVEIDQQLPALTGVLERIPADEPVTVVLGPGTPQLNLAAFLATFSGVENSDRVEVVQVRAVLGTDGKPNDSICVPLSFPGMVGRRMARAHAARRLADWELSDACLLVGTLAGFDDSERALAQEMGAYLLRQPAAPPGTAPSGTPALDAAAHCLDLVECMWERREREGWSVVFHVALLVNELVPAAWLEHGTGQPYDANDGGGARTGAERFLGGVGWDGFKNRLFVSDAGAQVYAPGRLVLAAMAPTAGRRRRDDPPTIMWPTADELVAHVLPASRQAAVLWIAAFDALVELRNRYAHAFETTDPGALSEFFSKLSGTVRSHASRRWLDTDAGEQTGRRRRAGCFLRAAKAAGSATALRQVLGCSPEGLEPVGKAADCPIVNWTASLLARSGDAELGRGAAGKARARAISVGHDESRMKRLLTRAPTAAWRLGDFGLVVEAKERGYVSEAEFETLVEYLCTGARPVVAGVGCVVDGIPEDCLVPATEGDGPSPLRRFLATIVPDVGERPNWVASRRKELLASLTSA